METPDCLLRLLDDEPSALNVDAALARVRATHPERPARRIWFWPVLAFASLASVLIAQQALSLLEVRNVVPLRYPAGQLPPELMLPNIFPLYPVNQVKTIRVTNSDEAAAQAGYRVRAIRSQLLRYEPRFRVEQYPVVERTIDRVKIEAALALRSDAPIVFPASLDGGVVALRPRGPAVVSHYGNCPRLIGPWDACAFLIQQNSPVIELPAGVNPGEYTEFSMRLIGLSPAEARAFRENFSAAPSLFLPFDEPSMLDVTTIPLRSGTGILVRYKPTTVGQAFSLQWTEAGQLFTLMGRDPSLASAIANSLEP